MFGMFRTLLALAVVAEHLGSVPHAGAYAVFGFYVLSGYLMTLILQRTYGYTRRGFLAYALNRWLRIYPVYYLSAATTLALVAVTGSEFARSFHENVGYTQSLEDTLRNLALVLRFDTETRWVPPAWALTIELFFYLMIGLGMSRTPARSLIWLGLSAAYTVYLVLGDASWSYRYFTVAASSLPFSLGAALYHLRATGFPRARLGWLERPQALWWLAGAIVCNYAVGLFNAPVAAMREHFYINLMLIALLVLHLSGRESIGIVTRTRDARVGDLSYPIYLLHYQVGLVVAAVTSTERGDPLFAVVSAALVVFAAQVVARTIDRPIQAVRRLVRTSPA